MEITDVRIEFLHFGDNKLRAHDNCKTPPHLLCKYLVRGAFRNGGRGADRKMPA